MDDSFILYGSYNRTDPRLDPVTRVQQTIDDVGLSISLTTLTSALAFFMGAFSHIPAVSWLCWYAFPTIVIDFIYQITFFISLVVLDERRIQNKKLDICFWSSGASSDLEETTSEESDESGPSSNTDSDTGYDVERSEPRKKITTSKQYGPEPHFADRFMNWFAKQLLKPSMQATVIVAFLAILGGSIYSATYLRQQFNYIDLVPKDSYLRKYYRALDDYTHRGGLYIYVFFRFVDQSDPEIQNQMQGYVQDLVQSKAIAEPPTYFWLRDFKEFVAEDTKLANMTFEEQIAIFLDDPGNKDLYGEHVVIEKNKTSPDYGKVIESRCIAYVDVNLQNSKQGTKMLTEMRDVTRRQPINQARDDWPFFTYADEYNLIE